MLRERAGLDQRGLGHVLRLHDRVRRLAERLGPAGDRSDQQHETDRRSHRRNTQRAPRTRQAPDRPRAAHRRPAFEFGKVVRRAVIGRERAHAVGHGAGLQVRRACGTLHGQPLAQPRMSASELRLGKTGGAPDRDTDLLVGQTFDVVQPQHRACVGVQPPECALDIDRLTAERGLRFPQIVLESTRRAARAATANADASGSGAPGSAAPRRRTAHRRGTRPRLANTCISPSWNRSSAVARSGARRRSAKTPGRPARDTAAPAQPCRPRPPWPAGRGRLRCRSVFPHPIRCASPQKGRSL